MGTEEARRLWMILVLMLCVGDRRDTDDAVYVCIRRVREKEKEID